MTTYHVEFWVAAPTVVPEEEVVRLLAGCCDIPRHWRMQDFTITKQSEEMEE